MSSIQLTPRETNLMRAVMAHNDITVSDWNLVAKTADFKTAKYARDTFTIIKKKLASIGSSGEGSATSETGDGENTPITTPASKTKKTPASKRKSAAVTADEGTPSKKPRSRKKVFDDEDSTEEFVLGKKKKALPNKKKVFDDDEMEDEDDEDEGSKVKKEVVADEDDEDAEVDED